MLEQKLVKDLVTTRKMRKFSSASIASQNDHHQIMMRIEKNGIKIDLISEILENIYGGKFKAEELLKFARKIGKEISVRVDRLANRNKTALLCWFSENWDKIYPILHRLIQNGKSKELCSTNFSFEFDVPTIQTVDPSDLTQLLNYH